MKMSNSPKKIFCNCVGLKEHAQSVPLAVSMHHGPKAVKLCVNYTVTIFVDSVYNISPDFKATSW